MQTFARTDRPGARSPIPALRPAPRLAIRQILHGPQLQRLELSRPDDPAEQEAERIAERVSHEPVQRLCAECEDELEGEVRRQAAPGPPVAAPPGTLPDPGPSRPLSEAARTDMEAHLQADFSGVRLHTGAAAAEAARALHAHAYTVGGDLVFGAGEYAPNTAAGRKLLAHELVHVIQQGGAQRERTATVQRAVDFRADFSNINLASRTAAAIAGDRFSYEDADFSADADIVAIGDSAAELAEWDVGVLQDMVVNWEREYWRRDNADRRGRFVEQKFRPIHTRLRDQADGAATVWSDDSEHQDLSALAPTPDGARFRVATTVATADQPGGDDTVDGEDVTGMDATDGTRNIDIQRIGTRFDTWISAHNTVSGAFRHLRRLNWNYQRSLDFTGSGATLAVGTETGQVGRHGPYGAGKDAPLTAGTTANDAMGDDANWLRRRVDGWT